MIETIKQGIDLVLHIDRHLATLLAHFGSSTYLILFLIVFCETGLVITPFLPGDSLLFATGAVASLSQPAAAGASLSPVTNAVSGAIAQAPQAVKALLNVHLVALVFFLAAAIGDTTNYWIGRWFGHRLSASRFVRKDYLARAHAFYAKHGGKTVFFARFMPILRTFAPFVAGISEMPYPRFLTFSLVGSAIWVPAFVYAGYFFGNLPIVKRNFTLIVLAIIFISFIPAASEAFKAWRDGRRQKAA
ncbi:MAG: VTT domain-containing protein [Spirochaetes bacterium]|nr:VTT domain-containing protein [Spirochaetota bacterium]